MRINLYIDENEERNLKALLKRYGGKATSYLRTILKQAYEKDFGGYKAKDNIITGGTPDVELTPEQICEQLGGKVFKDTAGNVFARLPRGPSAFINVPMSMMGKGDYKIRR